MEECCAGCVIRTWPRQPLPPLPELWWERLNVPSVGRLRSAPRWSSWPPASRTYYTFKKKTHVWPESPHLKRGCGKSFSDLKRKTEPSATFTLTRRLCQTQKRPHAENRGCCFSVCGHFDIKTWARGQQSRIKAVNFLSSHHFNKRSSWWPWKQSEQSPKSCPVQTERLLQTGRNLCESVCTTWRKRSPVRSEHAFSWPHQVVPPCKRLLVLVSNVQVTSWHQDSRTRTAAHKAELYLYHLGWAAPDDMHMVEQKNNISQPGEEEVYGCRSVS